MKVGKYDPGVLAKKIREKHDIEGLIKDKIVESDPHYHFERIQLERFQNNKTDEYLKEHPI